MANSHTVDRPEPRVVQRQHAVGPLGRQFSNYLVPLGVLMGRDQHRHNLALGVLGEFPGLAQHLLCYVGQALAGGLGHNPDALFLAVRVPGQGFRLVSGPRLLSQFGQALAQGVGHLLGGVFRSRLFQQDPQPVGLHQAYLINPGRRTFNAEQSQVIGKVGGGHLLGGDTLRSFHLFPVGVELWGHALGHADQRRQVALQGLEPFVGDAFDDH